jgi:hypothetical protein
MVAVPDLAPALLVSRPTTRAVWLLPPAARRLNEPLASTGPLPLMLALRLSEKLLAGARLLRLRA